MTWRLKRRLPSYIVVGLLVAAGLCTFVSIMGLAPTKLNVPIFLAGSGVFPYSLWYLVLGVPDGVLEFLFRLVIFLLLIAGTAWGFFWLNRRYSGSTMWMLLALFVLLGPVAGELSKVLADCLNLSWYRSTYCVQAPWFRLRG